MTWTLGETVAGGNTKAVAVASVSGTSAPIPVLVVLHGVQG